MNCRAVNVKRVFYIFFVVTMLTGKAECKVLTETDSIDRIIILATDPRIMTPVDETRLSAKISGQTLGKQFEKLTMEFLQDTFPCLQELRPGRWTILQLGNNNRLKTSDFAQYEHLSYLSQLTSQNAQLAAVLGNDYLVAPDIVVYRDLYEDREINAERPIVDEHTSTMADIRRRNGGKPILHASVSAKYTMRSDRASADNI